MSLQMQIQIAEDDFNAYAAQAEEHPARWGEEQNQELARLGQALRKLYDAASTPEFDRIQGI